MSSSKVFVVTGAGRGIGRDAARQFAGQEVDVRDEAFKQACEAPGWNAPSPSCDA